MSINEDYIVHICETETKRALTLTDASNSVVSGDGIANIEPFKNYTVTVTAKDLASANVGTGGDSFYVRISNECTITSQTEWKTVVGAANTMSSQFEALMTYNGDGTYTYNYTLSVLGKVSIWVILRNTGIVKGDFYTNYSQLGSPAVSNISTDINFNWGSGSVVSGVSDCVSANFKTYLRPNVTDTYTIWCFMDNGANVTLNGDPIFREYETGYYGELSTTITLTAFTNYYMEIDWREATGGAAIILSWQYTGVSKIVIPYPNYVWPQFVGSSPFTFTVSCPSGYSSTVSGHSSEWYPICGDGKRNGVEVCDDGNTNSTDGCRNDCLQVEYNCSCSGGTSSTPDICSCKVEQPVETPSRKSYLI